jgi:hypothetical protein
VDSSLQGGVRDCFMKRLPAQHYRSVAVPGRSLDSAEEDERLGARTIIGSLDQCLLCERARALYVACSELGHRPQDRASVASFAIVDRRQAAGELAQLRSHARHAPDGRDRGSLVERRGDLRVRTLRRKREVAGALQRIADELGENGVRRAPCRFVGSVVDARSKERVHEPETVHGSSDDAVGDRCFERVRGTGPAQRVGIALAHRGQEHERVPRRLRQRIDARSYERIQRLRDRQRPTGVELIRQGSCDLERVEGIAARRPVDLEQRRSREDAVEPVADDGR